MLKYAIVVTNVAPLQAAAFTDSYQQAQAIAKDVNTSIGSFYRVMLLSEYKELKKRLRG